MEKRIIYQSRNYEPQLVTGIYFRCTGTARTGYVFRVFECATGTGNFAGKPGHGGTLREYDCDGSEIPAALRADAIASKQTTKWS